MSGLENQRSTKNVPLNEINSKLIQVKKANYFLNWIKKNTKQKIIVNKNDFLFFVQMDYWFEKLLIKL